MLFVLASCAHWKTPYSYPVLVDIVPNAQVAVDRKHAFCFITGAAAYPSDALPKQQRHDDLARICSEQARKKGVSMAIASASSSACVPSRLDWSVAPPNDPNARPEPREFSHSWRSRRPRFSKLLKLTAFHPEGGTVVEATATTWTEHDGFTNDTAEVLCRALFANFPFQTNAKRYDVALQP